MDGSTGQLERRSFSLSDCKIELRGGGTDGQPTKIVGYPIVFNSMSNPIPGGGHGEFREIVHPDAISAAMKRTPDVRALIDHQPTQLLGRTKSGTLRLIPDQYGLRCEIDPPDTTYAKDLVESLRRGDLDGMSFGFETRSDKWADQLIDGKRTSVRTLHDLDLHDVSVVTFPAYPETEVAVRSLAQFRQEAEVAEAPAEEPAKSGITIWEMRRQLLAIAARRCGEAEIPYADLAPEEHQKAWEARKRIIDEIGRKLAN